MAATKKEIADLLRQHEAIRAHMKFLTKSLSDLAIESGRGTAQSSRLKDQITLYRWSLYDFREAIQRHIELDNRILEITPGNASMAEIISEHDNIQKQMDDAIELAENAVYNKLEREEINQCALKIRETVNRICELIKAHTAKEDRLSNPLQQDF